MIQAYRCNLVAAIRTGGPKIVFDFSFMRYLDWNEQNITIRQVALAVGVNRGHKTPFHLHFTGVDLKWVPWRVVAIIIAIYFCLCFFSSDYWKKLTSVHLQHFERHYDYLITVETKSHMELFPVEQLVYLSPMSRHTLEDYDEDQVYILGAMIDKNHPQDVCAHAKRLGIKTAKLPLINYVNL